MREIKFRAWDKKAKVMVIVLGIDFEDKKICCYADDHQQNIHTENYRLSFEDCELREFAGLKDRNNVEIFEGDIVSYENSIYTVGFRDAEFLMLFYEKDFEGDLVSGTCYRGIHLGGRNDEVKVIGNIYQNKNLLKGGG